MYVEHLKMEFRDKKCLKARNQNLCINWNDVRSKFDILLFLIHIKRNVNAESLWGLAMLTTHTLKHRNHSTNCVMN